MLNAREASDATWAAARQAPNGHDHDDALWVDDETWSEADIQQRPWIARGYALRGAVTVIFGPPSAMKSSLMLAWAAALALGRPHGDFRPISAGICIVYNVEDNSTEQRRRLSAVLRQFGASPIDLQGKVIRTGPRGVGTLLDQSENGGYRATGALQELCGLIEARRPDLLIVDPLAELHTAEENDNTALRGVIAEFRTLASRYDLAVVILHHTRKGTPSAGDADGSRGSSAIIGGTRAALSLLPMSEDDAKALGLPTSRRTRSRYVRLDDARQSYAAIGEAHWYQKTLYDLDNGETIPAAEPWTPPNLFEGLLYATLNDILDEIDCGLENGNLYSSSNAATKRAAWPVVKKHSPEKSEKQCRKIIATWVENGVLVEADYKEPNKGEDAKGLRLNPAKRPGTEQSEWPE